MNRAQRRAARKAAAQRTRNRHLFVATGRTADPRERALYAYLDDPTCAALAWEALDEAKECGPEYAGTLTILPDGTAQGGIVKRMHVLFCFPHWGPSVLDDLPADATALVIQDRTGPLPHTVMTVMHSRFDAWGDA